MSGGEFEQSGYCKVNAGASNYNKQGPIAPPCKVANDPECPDFVFEGLWEDIRTQTLPYTVLDVYDRAATPTNVSVLLLENDQFKATITPQWGGRLWGLKSKATGKDLFHDSAYFQPSNDALRQAYIEGGCEWNFGTQIGHMSQTTSDVSAFRIPTEHGDVVRVFAFERISGAVWQVDMLAANNSMFYIHPKLTNPGSEAIQGYWWTNVGVATDADGTDAVRILTPADHWISDSTEAARPPWPVFHERTNLGLGAWSANESKGDWLFPNFADLDVAGNVLRAAPIDHSYGPRHPRRFARQ